MDAESIRIETDEDGFWLLIEADMDSAPGSGYRFRITDPEALYDHVKAAIGPWLYERDMARQAAASTDRIMSGRSLNYENARRFACDPDESVGQAEAYERSDPKHPDFHSVHADLWDMREKNPDEYEYLRDQVKREKAGEE